MIFNCSKFKDTIAPNTLYAIRKSGKIQFIEKQKEINEEDYVYVKFTLDKGQYGMFANEYRPGFIANSKKVDIFLLIVDEEKKLCASWIFDVKVSVGGEDVIKHLIEQWLASYQHKRTFMNYLTDFSERETIGVIARNYQAERIVKIVEKYTKEIETMAKELDAMPDSSIKMIKQRDLLRKKMEYKMFDKFKNGYVEIDGKDYPIVVYNLEGNKAPYVCEIEVKC